MFINESMEDGASIVSSDHINVKYLDSKNLSIISTVMAQTVSLDYYADAVDRMLEKFQEMNLRVENMSGTGLGSNPVGTLDKTRLYKLVALNNTVITNVLSKLGHSKAQMPRGTVATITTWEALNDFELDYRFKDPSLKLTGERHRFPGHAAGGKEREAGVDHHLPHRRRDCHRPRRPKPTEDRDRERVEVVGPLMRP